MAGFGDLDLGRLGFGAAPLGDAYAPIDDAQATRTVHAALDRGLRFFDVAPYYGQGLAEERLGRALAGKRDRVVLATKCCRSGTHEFDFSAAGVARSVDASLARLRTGYVDLLQIHDCEFADPVQIHEETIPALEALRDAGKARFIGITGLPLGFLRDVATGSRIDTILSYCHGSLLCGDVAQRLAPFCAEHGIALINGAPLHMGLLGGRPAPPWHPATPAIKACVARLVERCRHRGAVLADVAIAWAVQRSACTVTLSGMGSVAEVESNTRAIDLELDDDLLADIAACIGASVS